MIRKIAWEMFKNTGDINTFMELKQIEDIEKGLEKDSLEENHHFENFNPIKKYK